MDYESVPFGCFHCFKTNHKAFQCLKAKSAKKKHPFASSHIRVKKVWKKKMTSQGQKGPIMADQKVAEASKKINQMLPFASTLPLGMDGKVVPQVLKTAPSVSSIQKISNGVPQKTEVAQGEERSDITPHVMSGDAKGKDTPQ